jgi:[ribosomal protein S18]-alanine N-acetyltransferase
MHYRLFESQDFDDLYAIEEVCFQPPHRFSRRYMRHLVQMSRTVTWVAEENFCLAGFAIVEWSTQVAGVVAYIATIEVLPQMRCHGIGTELMRRIEGSAHAEGAVEIWLHVDAENTSAIRIYEAFGYHHSGRAENYYARGRAAKIYIKELTR